MERKTKHRLLGMIMVIALVVLCLPLMQQQPDASKDAVITNAPATLVVAKEVAPIEETVETAVESDQALTPLKPESISSSNDKSAHQEPVEQPLEQHEPAQSEAIPHDNKVLDEAVQPDTTTKTNNSTKHIEPAVSIKIPARNKPIIRDNGLFDIKTAVWVVQVGSFSSKARALQLSKKMRADRYAVFTQQMNSHTHLVFVGPELSEQSARTLADTLERRYHVRSMVASYKPLT